MKKIFTFLLVCMLVFSLSATAFAVDQDSIDITDVQSQMEEYLQNVNLPIEVENFSVSLRNDLDLSQYSDKEISEMFTQIPKKSYKEITILKQN